jgi:hypothetical protein
MRHLLVALALVAAGCGSSGSDEASGTAERPDQATLDRLVDCEAVAAYENARAWEVEVATKSRTRQEMAHAAWVESAIVLRESIRGTELEMAIDVLIADPEFGVTLVPPTNEQLAAAAVVNAYLEAASNVCGR